MCSAQSALSVPAFLFLLPEISALEGLRHPWNAPPHSDTRQVWRFWRPVLPWWPCLGRKSKTSHPKAVSDPGAPRTSLWSLVCSRYDQEAAADLLRGRLSSDMPRAESLFPISRFPRCGGPSPPPALKGSALPCSSGEPTTGSS